MSRFAVLSSIDKGAGMMTMLNETPIDYVTFGNHEDDIEHKYVCQRNRFIHDSQPVSDFFFLSFLSSLSPSISHSFS